MKKAAIALILLSCFLLLTCGIEEYYYLPQVPEINITTEGNTYAQIILPPLSQEYALYYTIYYRFYVSDYLTSSSSETEIPNIHSTLNSDYNYIKPNTDPTNPTASTAIDTMFTSRNYYQLEYDGAEKNILSTDGGTLRIEFPALTSGGYPNINIDNNQYRLKRSSLLISPEPDLYFRSTPDLRNYTKATDRNINYDVSGRSSGGSYTYVSMYIVAAGVNPSNFTSIYSRPTQINVFLRPDAAHPQN
jgi:hypothetical protein